MACRAKVNDFYPVGEPHGVDEHDVLRLQVSMDEAQVFELEQGGEHLLRDGTDELEGQGVELVLLKEVIQVLLEHLKHQAGVVLVVEALVSAHEIELVGIFLREPGQYSNLNLALSRVRRVVLQDLDGNDLVGALLPAFDDLPKGASA